MSKTPSASFRTILENLIARVEQGKIPRGAFFPTERELQDEFALSRTTVRRALAAIVEAGYGENIPNRGVIAKSNNRPKPGNIAFIDGSTVVLKSMFRTMATSFLQLGYQLLHIDSEVLGLETSIHYAIEKECAAAFVWPFEGFPDVDYLESKRHKLPLVALDHRLRGFETDLIQFDAFSMGREATAALIEQGCQRIAVTGMFDMLETTQERFNGYLKGIFDAGLIPSASDFVFSMTSGMSQSDGRGLRNRLMSEDRPDGLLILQDEFAVDALQVIQSVGLRIPDDVKVATIGDDMLISVGGRRITAVHCDWNDFSHKAIQVMLQRLQNPHGPRVTHIANHQLRTQDLASWVDSPSSGGHDPVIAGSDRPRRPSRW